MEYREMFNLVDTDGGGSIGREEVLDLMGMVGYQCTEEEVDDMISEMTCASAVSDVMSPERSSSSTPCHSTLPGALPGAEPLGLDLPPTITLTASGCSSRTTSQYPPAR